MNRLEFLQTGGFPLNNERLSDMQDAYGIFNALGYLGGDKTILSGCIVAGFNTGNGFVFLNGEVFPFVGGATMTTVKIIEETTSKEFQDGTTKPVFRKRYVTFASGTGTMPWVDFKRSLPTNTIQGLLDAKATNDALAALITRVNALEVIAAPFRLAHATMVFFRRPASDIPAGWQEVVDWRGRLAMGMNPDDPDFAVLGSVGGSKTATISVTIPNSGWSYSPTDKPDTGDGGQLVVGSSQHENSEYLESLALASNNKTVNATGNVLNPHKIVMYIEPIPVV